MQHDHCSYCGTRYPSTAGWPRTCAGCGETTWSNPLPVAVALLPVSYPNGGTGLIVVRRAIEPFLGELALPGGFIETGESWKQAAVRELSEETGILAQADDVQLFAVQSSYNGHSLLVFGILPVRAVEDLPVCTPNDESLEWFPVDHPQSLAFPSHTQAMADFFAANNGVATGYAASA